MGALSPIHLIIVLVIALLVIGPGKLPEVGAALGNSIREFRKATTEAQASALAGTPSAQAPAALEAGSPIPVQPAVASVGLASDGLASDRTAQLSL